MKEILEISTTYDEIITNIQKYVNIFLKNKILAFRSLYLTESQQIDLMCKMGDILDWFPNTKYPDEYRYVEDHTFSLTQKTNIDENEVLVDWHLEHCSSKRPQCAASWNMTTFTCGHNAGRTGFIDNSELLADMPKRWQSFLESCVIVDILSQSTDNNFISEDGYQYPSVPRKAVLVHPQTKNKIVRINTFDVESKIVYIKGKIPTIQEQEIYLEICKWYRNQIRYNKSRPVWWSWSEGDLLIPDLLCLTHAVTGGFDFLQREFIGYWAYSSKDF